MKHILAENYERFFGNLTEASQTNQEIDLGNGNADALEQAIRDSFKSARRHVEFDFEGQGDEGCRLIGREDEIYGLGFMISKHNFDTAVEGGLVYITGFDRDGEEQFSDEVKLSDLTGIWKISIK